MVKRTRGTILNQTTDISLDLRQKKSGLMMHMLEVWQWWVSSNGWLRLTIWSRRAYKSTTFWTCTYFWTSLNSIKNKRSCVLRSWWNPSQGVGTTLTKPAWSLQQPAAITQSCWGYCAQQHWCHETDGPHYWTQTVSASHPGSQSAARKNTETNMAFYSAFTLVDDISKAFRHTSLSILALSV